MSAQKPPPIVVQASTAEVKVEVIPPTVVLSRRAGRFEIRETVKPGKRPADLESALNGPTGTGPRQRRLARLDLYLRELASGRTMDENFFGEGVLLDVPGYPRPAFCVVNASGQPVGLRPKLLTQVMACVGALRTPRPGRHARGKPVPPTRAEHFHRLAVALGHIGSQASPASVQRMVRAGKRALGDGK